MPTVSHQAVIASASTALRALLLGRNQTSFYDRDFRRFFEQGDFRRRQYQFLMEKPGFGDVAISFSTYEANDHVDNLCCFLLPRVVALTWKDGTASSYYERSSDAYAWLSKATNACGRQLVIHKIHQPTPFVNIEEEASGVLSTRGTLSCNPGERLAASYINSFSNDGEIRQTFNDVHDTLTLDTLQSLSPEQKGVGMYAPETALGSGNIHGLTQQQTRG